MLENLCQRADTPLDPRCIAAPPLSLALTDSISPIGLWRFRVRQPPATSPTSQVHRVRWRAEAWASDLIRYHKKLWKSMNISHISLFPLFSAGFHTVLIGNPYKFPWPPSDFKTRSTAEPPNSPPPPASSRLRSESSRSTPGGRRPSTATPPQTPPAALGTAHPPGARRSTSQAAPAKAS